MLTLIAIQMKPVIIESHEINDLFKMCVAHREQKKINITLYYISTTDSKEEKLV